MALTTSSHHRPLFLGDSMMFRNKYLKLICSGQKTQTRRIWNKPKCRVGDICYAKSNKSISRRYRGIPIRIVDMYMQRLGDITPEEVKKEGFNTFSEFKSDWIEIYGEWNPDQKVWVVVFEVI
jgi:hypothetical protein